MYQDMVHPKFGIFGTVRLLGARDWPNVLRCPNVLGYDKLPQCIKIWFTPSLGFLALLDY